jgi:hypothetical protein
MPAQRKTNQSRGLTAAGLIAVTAATLLMMAWAIFPTAAQAVFPPLDGNCPKGGQEFLGGSGSQVVNGVTISWSGQSVTISGGTASICVKAANFNSGILNLSPGTYVIVEWDPQGGSLQQGENPPAISHIQVYSATTPPTSTSTTATTTSTTATTTSTTATSTSTTATTTTTTPGGGGGGGTTTTPPASTTPITTPPIVAPTTVHNTSSSATAEVLPTTVRPGKLAFTGIEDVVPIGALALTLMTTGSGLLWAGSRRRRHDGSEDED